MIVLNASWWEGALHIWGESIDDSNGSRGAACLLSADELRQFVGDHWDSLLVAGGETDALELQLPHDGQAFQPSMQQNGSDRLTVALNLENRLIPTLRFSSADGFDLLTTAPRSANESLRAGKSLSYWISLANLVRSLLAQQRFAPAIHRDMNDNYHGFWRVVVDDETATTQLSSLIESMPPVCRSFAAGAVDASELVEDFLWRTVDGSVRRCLVGDELAHAITEAQATNESLQTHWLQSLVGNSSTLGTSSDQGARAFEKVQQWLSKLKPAEPGDHYVTCFRLDPPSVEAANDLWRLTLQVQSTSDPSLLVDASTLAAERFESPAILDRPFSGALDQIRRDAEKAARQFSPLEPCAAEDGPYEIELAVEMAYRFLKEAKPVLEVEGFRVIVPHWWREDGPKPRMWLHVSPPDAGASENEMRLDSLVAFDWRVAVGDEELGLSELRRLAAEKAPLVQFSGQWTEIQAAELEAAVKFLETQSRGTATALEALRLTYMADDLHTGLPVAGIRAHGWVHTLFNATHVNAKVKSVDCPGSFHGELRPYQLKGLAWLDFLARHGLGACLCDDMGLGKTIQLIALFLHERVDGKRPGPTLLIVPMSLVGNWQRELERFGPSIKVLVHHGVGRLSGEGFAEAAEKHDVVLCTYGLAHRDHEHLAAVKWHRVALDEAQNIKNPAAKQSMAVRGLQAVHRLAMTGTPVENRLSELWSIIDFLNPGYLGSAPEFRRRLAVPIERQRDPDRTQRLRDLIRPFVLRRRKSDPDILPDLPAKWEMTVLCNMTKEQAALYEATVDEMLRQIDQTGGIQRRGLILATLVKLKQICNHPLLITSDNGALAHRSGKCDRITEMVEELVAEGDRALIFTQFRQMGHLLERAIGDITGRETLFFHGGTSRQARDKMVEAFQAGDDRYPVMVLSLKAGGLGLNLNAANHVFHFDRWWNPAVEDQATDRAHRIGQQRQLQVHKFVCIGTLEERIAAMIDQKRNLAENIVGGGEDWLTELDTNALRELFRLSRDAVSED